VSEAPETNAITVVFRLPRTTYLVLVFLVVGITPIALYGGPGEGSPARLSLLSLLYLLPILAAIFIARTYTRVNDEGIRISAVFGSRGLPWQDVRGLAVTGRNVYAVTGDGSLRLPCVRQRDLSVIAVASGDRLPKLPFPRVKAAPGRGRRR
jgi:hypothetical protein